ncbi:hypothetical protein A4A49_52984 [Nicotiana attenuata]|uniref:SWIM-type domain-containing protein n=1 Tax=Nicotiana attenuata TaxID=49451 RepID=A0A1J6KCC8_NICAT|nr:hypothetical protein A4A49_52984 [Nicotiana attenuata]
MVDNNFTESFNSWILEARHKPIVKMLEDIRVKVMNQLKDRAEEVNSWRGEYSPYAMELYNDYRDMASKCKENFNGERGFEISEGEDRHTVILEQQRCTCRLWDLFGIPCAHAIRAFLYKKQDPTLGIHWWYSKQARQLVYQHKLQPVRGGRFWKVEPHQAMDPPLLGKMVGRPKLKRSREKDEARKSQGQWSTSRKGLQMTCNHTQTNKDQESEFFMVPTPGFKVQDQQSSQNTQQPTQPSSHDTQQPNQQSSQTTQQPTHPSSHDTQQPSQQSSQDTQMPTQHSNTQSIQTRRRLIQAHFGAEADPVLRPKVVSDIKTRLQRDHTGSSQPTKLPYSPKKTTWKGKETMTTAQLLGVKEKKIGKLKARRGKGRGKGE